MAVVALDEAFISTSRALIDQSVKLVVFDMDGTAIDCEGENRAAVQAAAGEHFPIRWDTVAGLKEEVIHDWLRDKYPHFDKPKDQFLRECHGGYAARFNNMVARDGMIQSMKMIREAGIPIAIVTNTCTEEAIAKLKSSGLLDLVDDVIGRDVVENAGGQAKPAPDLYLEAARRFNVDPENIAGFEDSKPGMTALIAAGVRFKVHIYDYGDDPNPGANFQVDGRNPEELLTVTKSLLGDDVALGQLRSLFVPQPGRAAHPR